MKKTIRSYFCLAVLFCLLFTACGNADSVTFGDGLSASSVSENAGGVDTLSGNDVSANEIAEPEEPPFPEKDITLLALGDNLIHMGVVATGRQKDGTYDFSFLFDGISDFLEATDIKIINQETILGGNELGFSGYPKFNSPTEIGDAIAACGFNVVLQASNHSADQGIDGLLNCISFWSTHPEVVLTGVMEEKSTEGEIPLLTVEDVTFAVLNYTYSPNSSTIPSSIIGHLNFLCAYDEKGRLDFTTLNPQVLSDIEKAKELADVVIVCPHWGNEYATRQSGYQEQFALEMTEAGADVIIGTHPHVVQPVEWITAENGNTALCFYSLGNYVSTQKNGPSMLEAMAYITFHIAEDGISITPEKTGAVPLVCHYTSGPVRIKSIYLLEDYTEELAAKHGIHAYGGVNLKLSDLQSWSEEILGDWVITREQILGQQSEQD